MPTIPPMSARSRGSSPAAETEGAGTERGRSSLSTATHPCVCPPVTCRRVTRASASLSVALLLPPANRGLGRGLVRDSGSTAFRQVFGRAHPPFVLTPVRS